MRKSVIFIFALASIIEIRADEKKPPHELDYCHPDLCTKPKTKHLACGHSGEFDEGCDPKAVIHRINTKLKHLILTKHNNMRSQLAMGLRHFTPAKRMATMRWSSELAFLAELNVKRCSMERSKCIGTVRYPHVGQNLAYNMFRDEQNVTAIVSSQINMWFQEYMKADMGSILTGKIPLHIEHFGEIKHFLQMARDRADRVGCAIAQYPLVDVWHVQSLTCVYNVGVDDCYPIYASSAVGGKSCLTGMSTQYPFLCNVGEKYDYIICPSEKFMGLPKALSKPSPCNPLASSAVTQKSSLLENIRTWYNAQSRTGDENKDTKC
ncbi:antigen 5 like allergen Cul n 1 [Drosophila tropicalis]|uniref:antigen 5 like allergen Cul n 1 n=1 Tax=Drosophila tropicalis TaxID=46794 RepID=UPI0035ABBA48